MIYLRIALILLWLFVSCMLGLFGCLVRWGDLNLDRDFGRFFSWGALRLSNLKASVEGLEHLEAHQPCIYVANHQSVIDMFSFGKIYPCRTIVIGKKELRWIPLFGLFFAAAGNIMINRQKRVKAIAGLGQAVDAIQKRNASIWIFPEGTRNETGKGLLPFKKGAFHMAISAGVPIVPILSSPVDLIFNWKKRTFRGGRMQIRVLPPIPSAGLTSDDLDKLSDTVREKMLEALRGLVTLPP